MGAPAWVWIPELGVGLVMNAAAAAFLWTSFSLLAGRAQPAPPPAPLALDATREGILVTDPQGRVQVCNRAFRELWGLPAGGLEPGSDGIGPDFLLAQVKNPAACLAGARSLLEDPASVWSDTLELWDGRVLERHGRPYLGADGIQGIAWGFRDVTSRAKADLFVHRLSLAVEQSPISVLITDTAGSIEFINPKFTQLTGYALDEALGRNPRILQSGFTPAKVYRDLWSTVTAGEIWVGELQNRRKDGELFWERATISPLRDADGVITHYLGLKEDITVQKRLEQQLRHAQRLEAVGNLAGGVAHDLNNILQVINGYGSLMQMTQAADDPNRAGLAEILKAAERAASLTHSLLAFSRKQVMNPRTLDLNGVVGNVEKLLKRIIGADIRLTVEKDPEPLHVHADLGQIEHVLLNLANNAREAMPTGGSLAIATRTTAIDAAWRDSRGFGQPGPYALLEVRDSGVGMDAETLRRVFDPYFTTREMGRGTGLGLATVYGIVKQHGGYIVADSEPGRGATFQVYLPIAPDPVTPQAAPDPDRDQVRGTETVLVAEDDPSVRGFLEMVLQRHGYQVVSASDGQEAVERFAERRGEVKLILMDVIMPRKGGRQAFEEIRAVEPAAKVLFISGYTADFIQSRGELGQDMELLMKPVQPLVLLRKMREILDGRP
ncbi:PAS domain S-box protein [Mesoterricola sediminis]|nr:PAS domain S-box protein [Mesoterricola sediminis]